MKKSILLFVLILLGSAGRLMAQSDLQIQGVTWKPGTEVIDLITEEKNNKVQLLNTPDLNEEDRVLFSAYVKMLNYVQTYVASGTEVAEALKKGFGQTISDSASDPAIKGVNPNHLVDLTPYLIEVLAESPKFEPIQAKQ